MLVRTHLEYSSSVWDTYTNELTTQIEVVQRRGARFIFNDYAYTSSPSAMITSLKLDPLTLRRKERRLNVLYDAIHGHLSIPARTILRPTTRSSRSANSNTFFRIQAKKDCYLHSFFPRTIIDWNQLPFNITSITDRNQFKQELYDHLRK
jgi:hypothetical protein